MSPSSDQLKRSVLCASLRTQDMTEVQNLLRRLPSVDRLLSHGRSQALLARFSRPYLTRRCREILDEMRGAIRQEQPMSASGFPPIDEDAILSQVEQRLASASEPRLRPVVNATGTVLHTNLGRALLPQPAIEAIGRVAAHPVNLEYDLARGARGRREATLEQLLIELTGAEAATVVNNNAAAVLLCLNTLATGKEAIVSRGELIEIGGAFRLPEIMAKSGAILKEVGTTNRTHPDDYEEAIGEKTGLLLKVHTSNYRILGFSSDVSLPDLVAIGRKHNIPVVEDLGSGALIDLGRYGLPKEPVVSERIALGVDVVTFSGDKVLGGPQAGLIVGRSQWVRDIARNPLHRALRCGKLTIAALEETLRLYQQAPDLAEVIPALKAFARPMSDIEALGRQVLPELQRALGAAFRLSLEDSTSQMGSGALPIEEIPTKVITIEHEVQSADRIAERFRGADPPILGRINDGRFLLDLRTIFDPKDLIPGWSVDA
jgi:L-seryl-tRNA(Ser) seleniumtransferase